MQVLVPMGNGQVERGDVVMLHEPDNGMFSWCYQTSLGDTPGDISALFLKESVIYLTDDRIVVFRLDSRTLWVRDSTGRYSTLDEGQAKLLGTLAHSQGEIAGRPNLFQEVNLTELMDSDVFEPTFGESPFPDYKLRSVARQQEGWLLLIEGTHHDLVDVQLDNDYQLVGATRLNPGTDQTETTE